MAADLPPPLKSSFKKMREEKKDKRYVLFFMLAVGAAVSVSHATAVSIKNNVSTTAETGGNSGDSIKTGAASAKSSVKTQVSQNGVKEITAEITAQANEKKQSVQLSGKDDVTVELELRADGQDGTVSTEKEVARELSDLNEDEKERLPVEAGATPDAAPDSKQQNFLVKMENFFSQLTNWLKKFL